ncbi:MAG: thioredoxin domain-containing protein [Candidatus Pelagibacter bacterium]|jgi:protein-disulfide isomerase|nr:thioredoxin domain-containing protein [Candidatus Pelagibacter sp.]MDC0618298.1 thioredoxin domain-containing protein [Candidatus Pelagibacter sp.]MDF1857348.1 thioredoxin domain-containing protein [Candidatus Pelagibacter bacterium]|tara:strand:+ start:174 stop:764 length:591 start_codon:yes stop_codon:yes gene_type:complete
MKKFASTLFIIFLIFSSKSFAAENEIVKRITEGEESAKITIIAYESLTCSYCANFHKDVYPELKKDFIDNGLVKIEFRHFPLDIAAFNASKIAQCNNDGSSSIMNILYSGQKKWARGKTPEEATGYLKKFLKGENVNIDFDKCLSDKIIEDYILNDRIEGVKKFKVNATPTIIINDKKFEKSLNYKNLKKYLEKLI